MSIYKNILELEAEYYGIVSFQVKDLLAAATNAGSDQWAVYAPNVNKIEKSFKELGYLILPLKVVQMRSTGALYLVGGRHRLHAAIAYARKNLKLSPNEVMLSKLPCQKIVVDTAAQRNRILQADNESRNMTPTEKTKVKYMGAEIRSLHELIEFRKQQPKDVRIKELVEFYMNSKTVGTLTINNKLNKIPVTTQTFTNLLVSAVLAVNCDAKLQDGNLAAAFLNTMFDCVDKAITEYTDEVLKGVLPYKAASRANAIIVAKAVSIYAKLQ